MSFSQLVNAQEQPSSQVTTPLCEQWLALLDQGQYAQSWATSSSYFKSVMTQDQWTTRASAMRNPLGGMTSRTFKFNKYSHLSPGSPPGEYVTTYFSTTFQNKPSSLETVSLIKDTDGQWRISYYMVQ
jgi:hypothetical protein